MSANFGVELRDSLTGALIRAYSSEGAALAFVRDVVRLNGRQEGTRFRLVGKSAAGFDQPLAHGEALVRRALEDRVL